MPTQDDQQERNYDQQPTSVQPNIVGGDTGGNNDGQLDTFFHPHSAYATVPLTGDAYAESTYAGGPSFLPPQQDARFSSVQPSATNPSLLQTGNGTSYGHPPSFAPSIYSLPHTHITQASGSQPGGTAAPAGSVNGQFLEWQVGGENSTAASNQRNRSPCAQCQRAQVRCNVNQPFAQGRCERCVDRNMACFSGNSQ